MKKDNFKKSNLSVKKPFTKGAALRSVKESEKPKATTPRPSLVRRGMGRFGVSKNKNGLWLYGFAARIVKSLRQTALPYDDTVKRYEPRKRKPNNDNFGFGAWNFKHWHKLSAAFVSIAIIGIVVFFQFAPENAQAKI